MIYSKHALKIIYLIKKYFLLILLPLSTITILIELPEKFNIPTVDIIISLIPMIFTILILSLSISDKGIFGVKFSEISGKRKDFHFTFFEMIIIAISIFVFAAICQIFNLTISIWFSDLIAVVYSIWFLIQEMPFIMHDEEKIKRVLIKNINLPDDNDKLGNNSFVAFNNKILLYVVLREGLYNAYDIVKNDNLQHNKAKILELFTLEINFYFDLIQRKESGPFRNSSIVYKDIDLFVALDNAFLDLELLLDHDNKDNFLNLFGKDSYYLITRLLFVLRSLSITMNCNSRYLSKLSYLFRSMFRSINFGKLSEGEIYLYNKIIIVMSVYSISKDEKPSLWFYEFLRDEVFDIKFLYGKDQSYFWFLSLYLYYVSKIYKRTPDTLRNEIDKFMCERSKGLNSDGITWKGAVRSYMNYVRFDEKIKLFTDLISIYNIGIGPGPWYMPPYSSAWSSADGDFSLNFVMNNLIGILVYDYNSFDYESGVFHNKIVEKMTQSEKQSLLHVLDLNWFNENEFKCDKAPLEMLCYFSNDFKTHSIINLKSHLIEDLKGERNRLVIASTEQILHDSEVPDIEIEEYKKILISGFKKGILKCEFLDKKIKLCEKDLKEYSFLIDVFDSKQLVESYAESLSNSIFNMLYYDFKRESSIQTLSVNDSNENVVLEKISKGSFNYKSKELNSVFYDLSKYKNNPLISGLKIVNLHLQGCVLWKENAIKMNVECADDLCTVTRLTDKQVNEIVDRDCKLVDGLYKFVGYRNESAYISREQAIELVRKKYILARIVFKKKTELSGDGILILKREY